MRQTALDMVKIVDQVFSFGINHVPDLSRCINNAKVTGHHAIIPTSNLATVSPDKLPAGEKNILTLVSAKLLCASAKAYRFESVKITAECSGTTFSANGNSVLELGWKQYSLKSSDEKNDTKSLPSVSEGQTFPCTASKSEHFTSPPKPYTEDTLLSAMEHAGAEDFDTHAEKKGLGTPATRAGTIEGLVAKGYVQRNGKQITATEKGRNLIQVVPEEVKSASMTAEWETKLQQIEHGQYSESDFMAEIEQFVRDICRKYGFADASVSFGNHNEPLGKCPKCGGDVVKGKYGFYCQKKCGMNVAKIYGKELSESQVAGLLHGKSTSFPEKGKKTIVFPEIAENSYNGKTYYQWKTERKS